LVGQRFPSWEVDVSSNSLLSSPILYHQPAKILNHEPAKTISQHKNGYQMGISFSQDTENLPNSAAYDRRFPSLVVSLAA
jgi:hypothetical protein